jgi:hypothetical protein
MQSYLADHLLSEPFFLQVDRSLRFFFPPGSIVCCPCYLIGTLPTLTLETYKQLSLISSPFLRRGLRTRQEPRLNPPCSLRWEETGLPRLASVVCLDSLVTTVLEETTGRPAMKSVTKPTPPILCDKELVAEVRPKLRLNSRSRVPELFFTDALGMKVVGTYSYSILGPLFRRNKIYFLISTKCYSYFINWSFRVQYVPEQV